MTWLYNTIHFTILGLWVYNTMHDFSRLRYVVFTGGVQLWRDFEQTDLTVVEEDDNVGCNSAPPPKFNVRARCEGRQRRFVCGRGTVQQPCSHGQPRICFSPRLSQAHSDDISQLVFEPVRCSIKENSSRVPLWLFLVLEAREGRSFSR